MLRAGHGLQPSNGKEQPKGRSKVTPRELFGLGEQFTAAQLRRAWVGLAHELHPDRWTKASPAVRRTKEEAMKRVNAAKDELELLAS